MNADPQDEASPADRKRVTSADVARISGVSRATVSYVLNNAPGRVISESTRELVLSTAQRLGHVPYAPARALRLGKSNIVLALVRDFAFGFASHRALRELDTALAARGFVVLAHRFDQSLRPLSDLWGLVSPNVVVAMGGLTVPEQAMIEGSHTKFVRAHGIVPQDRAGEMQVEYLVSRGHRVLGYAMVDTPAVQLVAQERLEGARRACRRLGIPDPIVEIVSVDDPKTAFPAIDRWVGVEPKVTAVCAHNDEVAIMVCLALTSRGLAVGTDLAVIGVDDSPIGRIGLTTIQLDIDAFSKAVIDSVLAAIDGKPPVDTTGEYLHLIVRDSA